MKREIKYTSKGYSYVDVTLQECINWGGAGICDGCNKGPCQELKLIWALGDTYCNKCFNEWLERQKNYSKEDLEYDLRLQEQNDKRYYEHYSRYFEGASSGL